MALGKSSRAARAKASVIELRSGLSTLCFGLLVKASRSFVATSFSAKPNDVTNFSSGVTTNPYLIECPCDSTFFPTAVASAHSPGPGKAL